MAIIAITAKILSSKSLLSASRKYAEYAQEPVSGPASRPKYFSKTSRGIFVSMPLRNTL